MTAQMEARPPVQVVHVIYGLGPGGAETLLYKLATRESGFEHQVICLTSPDWYSARLEAQGIPVHYLKMVSVSAGARGLLRLNRLIRESGADVVHGWMYRSNVLAGLFARAAGIPVIWSIHNAALEPLRFSSRVMAHVGGLLARWIPNFVINCSARSDEIHHRLGYSLAPGAVIHNGYDAEEFSPDDKSRNETRQALRIEPDEFLMGTISRWDRLKDIPNLLEAISCAKGRGLSCRCLLVGDGLDVTNGALMSAIEAADCKDLVMPLGRRPDVRDLARAMDLHILPSRTESFPNVVAETMLSRTPNVVTDVGDSAMMVGETGWVVRPRDPVELAEAIVDAWGEWKHEPDAWETRRSAARRQIADRFTFEKMAEDYEKIWRRVAERK